jgi:hypothetical protein
MLGKHSLENLRQAQAHVERLLQGETIEEFEIDGFATAMWEMAEEVRDKARENARAVRKLKLNEVTP